MASQGRRVGPRKRPSLRPTVLLLAVGTTLTVIAWGYLVKAAIDFGVQAREGTPGAWTYLGLACAGAVACLFVALMLVARMVRTLGMTSGLSSQPSEALLPPRSIGGRRASR